MCPKFRELGNGCNKIQDAVIAATVNIEVILLIDCCESQTSMSSIVLFQPLKRNHFDTGIMLLFAMIL